MALPALSFTGALHAQAPTEPAAAPAASAEQAQQAPQSPSALPAIVVTPASRAGATAPGAYTTRRSVSATGLPLSARDTPQSVSTVTRAVMDDFRLDNINDALAFAPGMLVERVETDRTYYTARGFDVMNFQLDGLGLPMTFGLQDGDVDTVAYERIDVTQGATGLMSGTGLPSATVNFVRKRPTPDRRASASLLLGSWNDKRVEGDVSGPLNAAGTLRGRLVAAAQDKNSYLDRYHLAKTVLHGVLEADLAPGLLLTAGHTVQSNRPDAPMWGALPLTFADGTPTRYDRSTSTAADWAYWNTRTAVSFAELRHELGQGWTVTATATYREMTERSRLFYTYGQPDAQTGSGLAAYPSRYASVDRQQLLDARAAGPFMLAGRRHEAVLGASISRATQHGYSWHGVGIGTLLPELSGWDGRYPEPPFTVDGGGSDLTERQRTVYAATRLNLRDDLKLIVGANHTQVDTDGRNYGVSARRDDARSSPYIGAVFDLDDNWSLYASRTAIFKPQDEIDANYRRLDPARGVSTEAGLKAEGWGGRLQASLAVFRTKLDDLASNQRLDRNAVTVHDPQDTRVTGAEIQLSGALTSRVKVLGGYSQVSIEDDKGRDVRTYTPRRVLRLSGTWQVTDPLALGASLRWQSGIWRDDAGLVAAQGAYALLDLMARYDFSRQLSASLNLRNVTDKRYVSSLYWQQGYYGAPRSASLALNWTY